MTKAYRVTLDGEESIVFTSTAARAKWICVRSYWEAGFPRYWPKVTVKRDPLYDNSPQSAEAGECWNPKYVKQG